MFYFFYYFPLGLDVRPRRFPWVTSAILATCFVTYLIQRFVPAFFYWNYNAFVFVPSAPSLSSLLLNAYFHGGWLHLGSNMISLLVFGPVLEDRLGRGRFIVLYHLTNVMANVVQGAIVLLVMPAQAGYGVLGASGAIAGVLGLFLIRLHFARLRVGWWAFMPLQAYTRAGTARMPAWIAIAVWFGLQLTMVLLQREGVAAGVACGSHLGGLVAGVGLALWLGLHVDATTEHHLHRGKAYFAKAAWFAAQGEFIEYVRRQSKDENGHLELARTYRLTERHAVADTHYRIAARLCAARKRMDQVLEIEREAVRGNTRFAFDPMLQLQVAQLLERSFQVEAAARAYHRLVESAPYAPQAPLALYRGARLVSRGSAGKERASELLSHLAATYPDATEARLARAELRGLESAA